MTLRQDKDFICDGLEASARKDMAPPILTEWKELDAAA